MPAHHELEAYLDQYMVAVGLEGEKNTPLFRSAKGKTGTLTENRLDRVNAYV